MRTVRASAATSQREGSRREEDRHPCRSPMPPLRLADCRLIFGTARSDRVFFGQVLASHYAPTKIKRTEPSALSISIWPACRVAVPPREAAAGYLWAHTLAAFSKLGL